MPSDFGLFGIATRGMAKHREDLGLKSVKEELEKKKKKKPKKPTKSASQRRIDDEIRRKRAARKAERMEVEGGYIE